MDKSLHALDFLEHVERHPPSAVSVVFGDETFLKREAILALRKAVLGNDDGAFSLTVLDGNDAQLRDVVDELSTVAMFGQGERMVIVEEADDFVSRSRAELEDYVARPKHHGVLVLDVKTWASNTRLYKAVAQHGLQIECKLPPPARLLKYLSARAKTVHGAELDRAAGEMLLELMPPELGLVDQELARIALLVAKGGTITTQLVQDHVGSWRARTTWELIDSATEGNARQALVDLDKLILAGEVPIALLGQVASTLRRFGAAAQLVEQAERAKQRVDLRSILERAGFKPFVIGKAERQLKQIGRIRGRQLYGWLLEADLAMKGASSAPARARLVLEELIVRLSSAADPRKSNSPVPAGRGSR